MILAICDSSFLSLPEVNDLLLMTFSIRQPDRMIELATYTTLGSLIGCCLLFFVGRRGGEALLRRKFPEERVQRIRSWYRRFGVIAIIVPSLLPPPTPFKIFVLAAGAFGIGWFPFVTAILIGRGTRYFSEGILAVTYGEESIRFAQENFGKIGLAVAAVIVLGTVAWVVVRRRVKPGAVTLALMSLALLGSGCISTSTVVPASQLPLPAKTATREEMARMLLEASAAVKTLSATVTLDASGGAMKTGVLTEYRQTKGFLLVERPNNIRMRAQAPLALATIFDMVSDGQRYKVSVPIRNKFITGDNQVRTSAENPILNLRPQHIMNALFVDVQPYFRDSRYRSALEEATEGRLSFYVFSFIDISSSPAQLIEKVWINRVDLSIARKEIFALDGVIDTDVRFSSFQDIAGVRFPSEIRVTRPADDYSLRLSVIKLAINEDLAADAFVLEKPAGAELVEVVPSTPSKLFR